ncbi:MAG: SRPBCC family protein [Myxococcales bacterium FL481]|nr:MAG: SRPBCC family protein [Myxococcales bacterium FL481]
MDERAHHNRLGIALLRPQRQNRRMPPSTEDDEARPALKRGLLAFGATTLLFLAVGMLLPKSFEVSRQREIAAPAHELFGAVANLRSFAEWNPWLAADPKMEVTFGERTEGVGASYAWASEQHGTGEMTIVGLQPDRSVDTELDFGDQGTASGQFLFDAIDDGTTRVTWTMSGDFDENPLMGWMALMMDSTLGPQFEDGLERLDRRSAKR